MGICKLIAVAICIMFLSASCSAIPNHSNADKNSTGITEDQIRCRNLANEKSEWKGRWESSEITVGKILATIILPIMIPFWLRAADQDAEIYKNYYENCMSETSRQITNPEN